MGFHHIPQSLINIMICESNRYTDVTEYMFKKYLNKQKTEIFNNSNIDPHIIDIITSYTVNIRLLYNPCYEDGSLAYKFIQYHMIDVNNVYGNNMDNGYMIDAKDLYEFNNKCTHLTEQTWITGFPDKKFDIIVTDTRFGDTIYYDLYKNVFNSDDDVKFEQIYPIETNDYVQLLIQRCIYNLNKNGICQIILSHKIMSDASYINIRKWLITTVNIRSIYVINYCSEESVPYCCMVTITNDTVTSTIEIITGSVKKYIMVENMIDYKFI